LFNYDGFSFFSCHLGSGSGSGSGGPRRRLRRGPPFFVDDLEKLEAALTSAYGEGLGPDDAAADEAEVAVPRRSLRRAPSARTSGSSYSGGHGVMLTLAKSQMTPRQMLNNPAAAK